MTAIHLPSFDDETAALDWLHAHYEVVRVTLLRGNDGLIRGSALVHPIAQSANPRAKEESRG